MSKVHPSAKYLVKYVAQLRAMRDHGWSIELLGKLAFGPDGQPAESGRGANVLDDPLLALHHFLTELRQCPGAPDVQPGDVVTTGTWTDAWPVAPGQHWQVRYSAPLGRLDVRFS